VRCGPGQLGEGGAVGRAELQHQGRDVLLDGPGREVQALGDLGIGEPVGHEFQHLGLAPGHPGPEQSGWQAGVASAAAGGALAGRAEQALAGGRGAADPEPGEGRVGRPQQSDRVSPPVAQRRLGGQSLGDGAEDRVALAGLQGRRQRPAGARLVAAGAADDRERGACPELRPARCAHRGRGGLLHLAGGHLAGQRLQQQFRALEGVEDAGMLVGCLGASPGERADGRRAVLFEQCQHAASKAPGTSAQVGVVWCEGLGGSQPPVHIAAPALVRGGQAEQHLAGRFDRPQSQPARRLARRVGHRRCLVETGRHGQHRREVELDAGGQAQGAGVQVA
jgi:hypothetical protein